MSASPSAPPGPSGVGVYVGLTGAGKTTLACEHARVIAERVGWPVLALDVEGGLPPQVAPPTHSVAEAIATIWERGESVRWVPSTTADVRADSMALLRAVRAAGECVVLVDGIHAVTSAHAGRGDDLVALLRGHRHAPAWALLTSQHYSGDVAQPMLACTPWLYIFRTAQPATLDTLERNEGLDPAVVRSLPRGECLVVHHGFPLQE